MIQYIFLLAILIAIFIRLKFRFWAIQPVFHIYDIHHWLNTNHVINSELPNINRYVKLIDIETKNIKNLSQEEKFAFTNFICENYLDKYFPEVDDIFPYFSTTLNESYLSVFLDNTFKSSSSNLNYNGRDVIGLITSRPLFLTFYGREPIIINYIDNLNVRIDKRNRGVAPNLIQTHHYRIRHINNKINVCMFKRESDMTAIVPLTLYTTKEFDMINICDKRAKYTERLVKIDKSNFSHFKDIIKTCASRFKCTLNIEQLTLFKLVMLSKIVIYVLLTGNEPICCYVLRKNPYEDVKYVDLITSINCAPCIDSFFAGFQSVCRREIRKQNTSRINIEGLGDSCQLLNEIQERGIEPLSQCPNAFFLYNYVTYSINPDTCLFIY